MKGKLHFEFKPKRHPYPDDLNSRFELWCEIILLIKNQSKIFKLIEIEWDIIPFIEWFVENFETLQKEALNISDFETGKEHVPLQSESLSNALDKFQQRDFDLEEDDVEFDWSAQLYDFRKQHSLRFAFPGSKIEPIIIGLNNDVGEVSLLSSSNEWIYLFDMEEFIGYSCIQLGELLDDFLTIFLILIVKKT